MNRKHGIFEPWNHFHFCKLKNNMQFNFHLLKSFKIFVYQLHQESRQTISISKRRFKRDRSFIQCDTTFWIQMCWCCLQRETFNFHTWWLKDDDMKQQIYKKFWHVIVKLQIIYDKLCKNLPIPDFHFTIWWIIWTSWCSPQLIDTQQLGYKAQAIAPPKNTWKEVAAGCDNTINPHNIPNINMDPKQSWTIHKSARRRRRLLRVQNLKFSPGPCSSNDDD